MFIRAFDKLPKTLLQTAANRNGMMVVLRSSVLGVTGSNLRARYCLLLWGKLWQFSVRLLQLRGTVLRAWFGMFEARLSCG